MDRLRVVVDAELDLRGVVLADSERALAVDLKLGELCEMEPTDSPWVDIGDPGA